MTFDRNKLRSTDLLPLKIIFHKDGTFLMKGTKCDCNEGSMKHSTKRFDKSIQNSVISDAMFA